MKKLPARRIRQAAQLVVLLIFLFLFRKTDYTGSDTIDWAVNIFFRLDPLLALSVTLAKKTLVYLLFPALIVAALTLFFGRWFCGWFCPLGTIIDLFDRVLAPVRRSTGFNFRPLKYGILVLVLFSGLFGVQLAGIMDPFSILVRGLAFAVDPMLNYGVSGVFDFLYLSVPQWLSSNVTEPVYDVLKTALLPYRQSFFLTGLISFVFLALVLCLSLFGRRFWCRNICPLGALLALLARGSFLRRKPAKACARCRMCMEKCRMNAFNENRDIMFEECNLCMDCLSFCPDGIAKITSGRRSHPAPVNFSRRSFIGAAALGVSLPLVIHTGAASKLPSPNLIRPPGALDEPDFLATCVRCGECMKVCITNGLQPLSPGMGIDRVFTPVLIPRLGYCEFNCTLCGQVCPTGALSVLSKPQKHDFVIGTAFFDTSRCLPYANKIPCIVCEEHCPTSPKAISFTEAVVKDDAGEKITLKQPHVIESLCIGCGICEHACPLKGEAAVKVTAGPGTIHAGSIYG